jgi:hypothetical protein
MEDVFDVADFAQSKRWLSQDMRGHTRFDVFRTCARILGGYYNWTLDEDSGKSTLKWIEGTTFRRYVNGFYHTNTADIDDVFSEFTEEITGSASVHTVHYENYGWFLNFGCTTDNDEAKTTLTIPGSPTAVTVFDLSLFLEQIGDATTPFQVRFLAGATELYKIKWDVDRKPTCYGASTNSGVIDHAFNATEPTLGRVIFTATNAAFSVKDPGDDTYEVLDATRVITANNITKVEMLVLADDDVVSGPVVRVSDVAVKYTVDTTGTALTTQPNPQITKEAKAIRSITVYGKDDLFSTVQVTSTSPRDMVVVNDGLLTQGSVNATAEAIALKYAANTRSIRVVPRTADTNYQVGGFYTVTAASDVVCRRAEYEHDVESNVQRWILDLDTGETTGHELLKRGISHMKLDTETSKVSNAHT